MEALVDENASEFSHKHISTEIENNPHSAKDRIAASNWKQMHLRNRRMT